MTYPPPTLITFIPSYYQCAETHSTEVFLTVVSATFASPFQLLSSAKHLPPRLNRFTWWTLPTINRKPFFMNILSTESFCPQKTHNRMPIFSSTSLTYDRHFDYWNQSVSMRICYLHWHEAGLCCYLVTHMENLLCPLELFTSICDLFTDSPSYDLWKLRHK
jgi:hypothetical protein